MTPDQAREILLRGGTDSSLADRIAGRVSAIVSHLEEVTQGAPIDRDLLWAVAAAEATKVCRRDRKAAAEGARAARQGQRLAG